MDQVYPSRYTAAMPTITQTVSFSHSPKRVFTALTDTAQHAAFTGAPAKITAEVGGSFSVYDDYAMGVFSEITPNKSYRQSWVASDWVADQVSTVTITLEPTDTGCTLHLVQTSVPEAEVSATSSGWQEFYWEPLAKYLDETKTS
jgi:uncharacterized protein YndB with AHSA1/START domain